MSERDPFDQSLWDLRDLIDQPVEPRTAFADELRSRLMSEMSASEFSREEYHVPMDALSIPRPPTSISAERSRRIRPALVLQLAAAALIVVLGVAAALNQGWFRNEPDPSTMVPAAILQTDDTPTAELALEPTATVLPTVVAAGAMQPTVPPPVDIAEATWVLPGAGGDLGGLVADGGMVYRLLATADFVCVQAVDGKTGEVRWQQAHQWTGSLFAVEDHVLYFDGGDNRLIAMDAETGAERWRAQVPGNPIALTGSDHGLFVLTDADKITALEAQTGDQLWVAQGRAAQNPGEGWASIPAIDKIAVEQNVVAAIANTGVLSGFDAKTGEELWALEGYDAATVAIWGEGDRFVVTSGAGMPVAGDGTSSTTTVAGVDDSTVRVVVIAGDCSQFDATSDRETDTHTFRAQAIDPATGKILWDRQTIFGNATTTAATSENPIVCGIDVVTGNVKADTSPNHILTVGTITATSGGMHHLHIEDGTIVLVGDIGADQQVTAVTTDDHQIYLQLADGSLVNVADGHNLDQSDDSRDDSHDD